MQQANAAYSRRDWAGAEQLCRLMLNAQADNFDALTLLGIIAAQTRRTQEAAELLGRAVAANPDDALARNNLGHALHDLRRYEEALASYDRAIKLNPDYAAAFYNRGNSLQELKRWDEALASYDRALTIRPGDAKTLNNRGNTLHELRRFDDALASFGEAIQLNPDYAEAFYNRGNTLIELQRLDEALASFDRAVSIRPDSAKTHNNRGNTLHKLERLDEALACYDQAIALNPDYAEAHNNRGITLQALERWDEALASHDRALRINPGYADAFHSRGNTLRELHRLGEALASFDQAIKLNPDFAEAHNNRGNALQELRRWDEALASHDRALTINPEYAEAYGNRGGALIELKRLEEALASYEKALELKAGYEYLYGTWLHTKMKLCDWSGIENRVADLLKKIENGDKCTPPFPVLALTDSPLLQRKAAERWARNGRFASHPIPKRAKHRRIRIGYYSADYHNHATAYLMAELFERHDRDKFELVAFSFGPNVNDEMRKRVSAAFDRFIDVRNKSDQDVALLSRNLEVDIAIDLKGFTQDQRIGIFSHRAAPIQISYIGYPGTSGTDFIDYVIADRTLIPEDCRQYFSEKIVYLPHSYQVNDRQRPIADKTFSREELNLPGTGIVFCCFNNNQKITPAVFDGWMRILKKVEGSVLWLLEGNPAAARNLRKEAGQRGVNAERLVFAEPMPLAEHLARHRAADLFIDTLPYNAHTTASDALWAGVPVLTCIGKAFAGRVAASLLNAIHLPELITSTQEEYEALAIELATHPDRLGQIRLKLEKNRLTTPLFDSRLFTRHMENGYLQMVERYQADLPPDHIYVVP